ncbi:hypothetical protein DXG01_001976 [Tephrocybe rancida]|nr:hypothetical protein DXG01_001976 [Tephrocybe rancida]
MDISVQRPLRAYQNTGAGAPLSSASTEVPSIHNKIEKLDFPGMVTLVAALTFLTVALNLGGQSRPWGSPTIIGMFCAAAVMTVAFVVAEKYAREPVAPMRYFAQWRWRNVPLIIVFLQVIGVSPINAGALIIPFLSMAAISSTVSTYFSHRTGLLRSPFIGALAVLPVGMGTQTSMVIAQAGLPSKELSTVTALVGSTPSLGGVLGVGIIGTIINNSFRASFVRSVGAATAASLSLNDVVKLVENTPPGVPREVVVQAYVHAWRIGCRVLAGVAVAQVLLALLLSSVEMDSAQNEGSTEAN